MTVAGLLLAAGGGRRFGRPKAAVVYDGQTLAARGVRMLRAGGCDPVLVVLGAADTAVDAVVVRNDQWDGGMGSSLRAGLAALAAGPAGAVVVALADQPLVGADAVGRLLAAWRAGAVAAVATYGGAPRNPVLLDRTVWDDVARLADGEVGARGWLRAHPDLVREVACDGTGSAYDVDTPEDLARLEEWR